MQSEIAITLQHLPANMSRLLLAAGLGSLIGIEREFRHRPGGLRTSCFICLGSAFFMLISEVLAREHGGDPQRIAAQIIPGIGFLGAGAILRDRGSVMGMTSAATVFVVASIGMAAGSGLYLYAIIATLIVLLVLQGFGWLERRLRLKSDPATYLAVGKDAAAMLTALNHAVESRRQTLSYVRCQNSAESVLLEFGVSLQPGQQGTFLSGLREVPEFKLVTYTRGGNGS